MQPTYAAKAANRDIGTELDHDDVSIASKVPIAMLVDDADIVRHRRLAVQRLDRESSGCVEYGHLPPLWKAAKLPLLF